MAGPRTERAFRESAFRESYLSAPLEQGPDEWAGAQKGAFWWGEQRTAATGQQRSGMEGAGQVGSGSARPHPRLSVLKPCKPSEGSKKGLDSAVWGQEKYPRKIPHGPVAKTPYSQSRGCGFNPWLGN